MKFLEFWPIIWDDGVDFCFQNKHITPYGLYTIDCCSIGYTCREKDEYARCIVCGNVSEIKTKLDDNVTYFILAVLDS